MSDSEKGRKRGKSLPVTPDTQGKTTRNYDAAGKQPVTPSPKTETRDESGGTDEMLDQSGPKHDAPPLRGTAKE